MPLTYRGGRFSFYLESLSSPPITPLLSSQSGSTRGTVRAPQQRSSSGGDCVVSAEKSHREASCDELKAALLRARRASQRLLFRELAKHKT